MRPLSRIEPCSVKADITEKPAPSCREEHAAAWRDALWRYGSALAAKLGWREDTVQGYSRIQAEVDSPSERLEKAIGGLLDLGVPFDEAIRPLAVTARRLGLGLSRRVPVVGRIVPHLAISEVLERTGAVVREATLAHRDGHCTRAEWDRIETQILGLEASIAALRECGRNNQPTGDDE